MGFAAGVLIKAGLNGVVVSVKGITAEPQSWRVGAAPILALLQSQPKAGYKGHELTVPSQKVQLQDPPFQAYKASEKDWNLADRYCNPGPIQYSDLGAESVSETIKSLYKRETSIIKQVKELCNSIYTSTMFLEQKPLLVSVFNSLKATNEALR